METYSADLRDKNGDSIRPITDWKSIQNVPDYEGQINQLKDSLKQKSDVVTTMAHHSEIIDGQTNWDTINDEGVFTVYTRNGINGGVHFPGTKNEAVTWDMWGFMIQMNHAGGLKFQIAFLVPGQIYARHYDGENGGSWDDWRHIQGKVEG